MLIELVGLPGSGKTTFSKQFYKQMRAAGTPVQDAQTLALDARAGKQTPRFVRARPERALLHRYIRFQRQNKELDALATAQFDDAPVKHLLFTMVAAGYQAVQDLAAARDVVVIDEGFVTHGVAAFYEKGDRDGMARYAALMPKVEMVMHLDPGATLAFERTQQRAGPDPERRAFVTQKHGELALFERRDQMMRDTLESYAARGVTVVRLDTAAKEPKALAAEARAAVDALLEGLG